MLNLTKIKILHKIIECKRKNMIKEKIEYLSHFIGNTPLLKISVKYAGVLKDIYVKCEWYNFSGSIKDRASLGMLKNYPQIESCKEICEVTSGNMGISLSALGAYLGLKVTIFMPKSMSEERKKLISLYGATLILCDDFADCFAKAEKYASEHDAFYCRQFENGNNSLAQQALGYEILKDCSAKCFVSGVGTSGTLSGAGSILKENGYKIVAIDPASSSLLTLGYSNGQHKIQGLSDGIIPKLYDRNLVDQIIPITDEDAIAMAQKLNALGIPCGISGGANFLGAVLCDEKTIATVFPDDNKKYLSTDLSKKSSTNLVDQIEILI